MPSCNYEILRGLPPYGPDAEPFTATGQGAHREGFVVRFSVGEDHSWVGNFQPGAGGLSGVYAHPNGRELLVVSRGQGYIVDPADRSKRAYFGVRIETVIAAEELSLVIFGDGLSFQAFGPSGIQWKTQRISWDGMQSVVLHGRQITGEAWSPLDNRWMPFRVDVTNGTHAGGSYDGPDGAG